MTAPASMVYFHSEAIPSDQPEPDRIRLHSAGLIDFVVGLGEHVDALTVIAPASDRSGAVEIDRPAGLTIRNAPAPMRRPGDAPHYLRSMLRFLHSPDFVRTVRSASITTSIAMSGFGSLFGLVAMALGSNHHFIVRGDRKTTVLESSRSARNKRAALLRLRLYDAVLRLGVRTGRCHIWFQGDHRFRELGATCPQRARQRLHLLNAVLRPIPEAIVAPSREPQFDLVFVGRLTVEKGLLELFEAMSGITPTPTLKIVGSGPDEAIIRRECERLGLTRFVSFAGYAGDVSVVVGHLTSARAFVLPSYTEGLPRAILEAMAVGLPVIATTVGGIPDLIEDGHNGRLVPPKDVAALRYAIERTLAADNWMLVGRARADAQHHSFESGHRRFLAVAGADRAVPTTTGVVPQC